MISKIGPGFVWVSTHFTSKCYFHVLTLNVHFKQAFALVFFSTVDSSPAWVKCDHHWKDVSVKVFDCGLWAEAFSWNCFMHPNHTAEQATKHNNDNQQHIIIKSFHRRSAEQAAKRRDEIASIILNHLYIVSLSKRGLCKYLLFCIIVHTFRRCVVFPYDRTQCAF